MFVSIFLHTMYVILLFISYFLAVLIFRWFFGLFSVVICEVRMRVSFQRAGAIFTLRGVPSCALVDACAVRLGGGILIDDYVFPFSSFPLELCGGWACHVLGRIVCGFSVGSRAVHRIAFTLPCFFL